MARLQKYSWGVEQWPGTLVEGKALDPLLQHQSLYCIVCCVQGGKGLQSIRSAASQLWWGAQATRPHVGPSGSHNMPSNPLVMNSKHLLIG